MARLWDEEIDERLAGLEGWERDGGAIANDLELAAKIEAAAG